METLFVLHLYGNAKEMNPTYSIQKPCTEDWGKMSPEQQGRHCQVCCKTVVDFTKKSDSEIINLLKLNADKKVCGRFKAEQLIPPAGSREPRKAVRHRLFFAALFLVFGGMLFTSCASTANNNHELMGDVAYVPDSTEIIQQKDITKTLVIDSTKKTGQIKPKCKKPVVVEEETKFLMGDVAYDPNDTIR